MRTAPPRPSHHRVITNDNGVRHWRRQMSFNGVSW